MQRVFLAEKIGDDSGSAFAILTNERTQKKAAETADRIAAKYKSQVIFCTDGSEAYRVVTQ